MERAKGIGSFFLPQSSLQADQINEFDADIVGATTITGQASSPVRVRHALGVATARADEYAKKGDYNQAAEVEIEVRTLTEMLKVVKVQWEMVVQAQKKLQIAVTHAEKKREWLEVAKFKKLQETVNEKLKESRERGAERQRESELQREAEKVRDAAALEAKDLAASAARVQGAPWKIHFNMENPTEIQKIQVIY